MKHILAYGNAPVDVHIQAGESILRKYALKKGEFSRASLRAKRHFNCLEDGAKLKPTGSIANVLCVLSSLGMQGTFVGRVGGDDAGWSFYQSMIGSGISMNAPELGGETMKIHAIGTPDGDVTHAVSGVNMPLTPEMVDEAAIKQADWLVLSAYMLLADQYEAYKKITHIARKYDKRIILNLSSPRVVEQASYNLDLELRRGIDLIIADGETMDALARDIDPITLFTPRLILQGHHGASFIQRDGTPHFCSFEVEHYLSQDLKDGFVAGFISSFIAGESCESALVKGLRTMRYIKQRGGTCMRKMVVF
jgi:sugar/nucleoside kinase (ribokinase family)